MQCCYIERNTINENCHPEWSGVSESRDLRFVRSGFNADQQQVPPLGLKSSVGMTKRYGRQHERHESYAPFSRFSIFAQVSLSGTVRLNTSAPGFESRSAQKYPSRSN